MGVIGRFFAYNNAVPIVLTVILSGAGAAFAAINPETMYDEMQTVVSVDNTYIANKNIDSYTPQIKILDVTEDSENYYVAYRFSTIGLRDAVWQDVTRDETLKVAKGVLGTYGDLGIYATEQFKQLIDREIAYLREVQRIEQKQVSLKVVATTYGGLIGKLLDDTTETIPGYVPVMRPPEPMQDASEGVSQSSSIQSGSVSGASTSQINEAGSPVLQLLGPNPHRIPLGSIFADLGVVVTDDSGYVPVVRKYVDGTEVLSDLVTVDTSAPREFHIRYEATDTDGRTGAVERTVVVYDQFAPVSEPVVATTTESAASSEPIPEPAQAPTSAPESASEQTPVSEPAPEPVQTPTPKTLPADRL